MGADYHLFCVDCQDWSEPIEYSIVRYIQIKHPDEAERNLVDWTKFLIRHSGHKIQFQDFAFKQSDPSKINGLYVLTGGKDI